MPDNLDITNVAPDAASVYPYGIPESVLRKTDLPTTPYVCGLPMYPIGGTVFLYGAPGLGKSFIQQGLNHTIAWGKSIYEFTPEYTANVLYCDFEGNAALTKERSLALSSKGTLATDTSDQAMPTDTHYLFADDWKGKTFAEKMAELEDILIAKENEDQGFSLVVIDTFTAFVGCKPGDANAYDYDRQCIETLNFFAEKHQICIVLIHHPNKTGEISGSMGRAGTAWIVMSLTSADEGHAVLTMEKNRLDRALSLCFSWDKDRIWRLSTEIVPKQALAKGNLRIIINALAKSPKSLKELREATTMPEGSLRSGLYRLSKRGDARCADGIWSLTFAMTQDLPLKPAWAGTVIAHYLRNDFTYSKSEEVRHEEAQAQPVAPAALPPIPKWRTMLRKGTGEIALPEIDATWRMEGQEKVWNVSPISTAIDLIMKDRDEGKLAPTWRPEFPEDITDTISGHHNWGVLPRRENGIVKNGPNVPWVSYDVIGSYLAAYKTQLAIKGLIEYTGEWTPQAAGCVLQRTPEWRHSSILGHPLGAQARPGEWQWVWNPSMRLLRRVADLRLIDFPQIKKMYLRLAGHQSASEHLLDRFYDRMKLARETYPKGSDELEYTKIMYSGWLSSVNKGTANAFKRPDWYGSIRGEAHSRLWFNGFRATESGITVLGMGNTDEICVEASGVNSALWPETDARIGKMKLKDAGDGDGNVSR